MLKLITTSSAGMYRACPRLYQIRVVKGVRARKEQAEALYFGSLWHGMQEVWWAAVSRARVSVALAWIEEQDISDPFEEVKLRELMRGYDLRWGSEPLRAVSIEQEFRAPLVNPDTGAASRTFELAGKKDLIAEDDDGKWLIEHKTSSEDIRPGSAYWLKLRMNAQVSNYYVGARANGHDIVGCLYDVVGKPKLKPLKATPEEARKYHKKTGALYANQRDRDETPEEYATRLREHIADNPDAYYQRHPVFRLEAEEREAARDMWHTARAIRDAERLDSFPRNDAACFRWNRACEFWEVCTGQADLADEYRFERVAPHQELSKTTEVEHDSNSNGSAEADVLGIGF